MRLTLVFALSLIGWLECRSQTVGSLVRSPLRSFYTVSISKENIRKVSVEAKIPYTSDTLYMSQTDFAPLENGFASFVHGLKATDESGKPVNLRSIGKGIWKMDTRGRPKIRLNYYVDIHHDEVAWKVSGAFARGYAIGQTLFFAGRSVFIASKRTAPASGAVPRQGRATAEIEVRFDLPAGWKVVTAYHELAGAPDTFEADDLSALWANGNFVGEIVQQEIAIQKLRIIIAGTPSMREGVGIFKDALSKIVDTYRSVMGGAPEGKLVIMGGVASLPSGGETFPNSISLMFSRPPDYSDKARWGYLLAHEIFHLWNGMAISPSEQSQVEWFVEGFTEYMSKLAAYKTGFITEDELLRQLADGYASYSLPAGHGSLVEGGTDKGAHYNLLYFGGMTAAFVLDIQCRHATHGVKGFPDIMRAMYAKFGVAKRPYTYSDIVKTVNEVAGADMSRFFAKYIGGKEIIPLGSYVGLAGLTFRPDPGGGLTISADAGKEQVQVLKAIEALKE